MGQNKSSAVMQQRREAHDSLDDFPTPPWATRALCEWLLQQEEPIGYQVVNEPAANRGFMVRPLREYFAGVVAADVHDYGCGFPVRDYLFGPTDAVERTHWTVCNPPFRLAEQFIERALICSSRGVAMLVRSAFVEGVGRYQRLFSQEAPTDILQFTERVKMVKGRLEEGTNTATAYCWLVWRKGRAVPTTFHWLAPCRAELVRDGDYPAALVDAGEISLPLLDVA